MSLTLAIKKPAGVEKIVQRLFPRLSTVLREPRAEKISAFVTQEVRLFSDAAIELASTSPSLSPSEGSAPKRRKNYQAAL